MNSPRRCGVGLAAGACALIGLGATGTVAATVFCPGEAPPPSPVQISSCPSVIVKFASPDGRTTTSGNNGSALSSLGAAQPTVVCSLPNTVAIKVKPETLASADGRERLRRALRERYGEIEYLEHSAPFVSTGVTPNDPEFLQNQKADLDQIHATQAWERIKKIKTAPQIVAVIDSGVNYDHPDLKQQLWNGNRFHGMSFAGGDPNDTKDTDGHGTKVAGLIAALSNNGEGIATIAWRDKVRLAIAKYTKDSTAGCTENMVCAIDYAARQVNARVLNLSASTSQCSESLGRELEWIRGNKEHTVIVNAVDDHHGAYDIDDSASGKKDYPASYGLANVITVEATNQTDGFIPSAYGAKSVDLAAPGNEVMSTNVGAGYGPMFGTSIAAPQISSVAAVIAGLAPQWTGKEVRQYIVDSVRHVPCGNGASPTVGSLCRSSKTAGILDVDAATGAPVAIDSPKKGEKLKPGSMLELKWHLIFKSAQCRKFDAYLSVDDGVTWSASSLNSGGPINKSDTSTTILLPADSRISNAARIGLRCRDAARMERWSDPTEIQILRPRT